MRLIGYACKSHAPPVCQVFLPLGDLTVVLGPNDSGKSTLLASLVRDLTGGHFGQDADTEHLIGGVFYGEISDHELQQIILATRVDRDRQLDGARPPFDDGLWTTKVARSDLERDGPQAVITDLSNRSGDGVRPILAALSASRIVAIECAGLNAIGRRVWNAYWCLEPIGQLGGDVADAVRASDLAPFRKTNSRGWRRSYEASHGQPLHLQVAVAPVAVISLGATLSIDMPQGLAVPADFETLRASVSDGITSAVNVWRHESKDAEREGDPLSGAEKEQRRAPRAWLEEHDAWFGVSYKASAICEFLSASANRLLPDFVSSRYRVRAELREVDEWFSSEPLRLVAWRPSAEAPEEFPIERVADGFQLWVQLALLRSLDAIRAVASLMKSLVSESYEHTQDAGHAPDETELELALEAAADADRRYEAVADEIGRVDVDLGDWISGELQGTLDALPDDDWTRASAGTRRFLIVDEPERHLHPRLQRAAAAWLAQTAHTTRAPLLLATHSPAFLSLPRSKATYVSVSRVDDNAYAKAFDPSDVTQLDELAQTMGYDRGELVGMVRVWLVVEGLTDKAVLDGLYGGALRCEGIEVVPMHGTAHWKAVLEADALWRFTTAPVAVMFDGLDAETIDRMKEASDAQLDELARSDKEPNEIKDMARLIRNVRSIGRQVHPVPFEPADILNALDETAVKDVFPRYPGHTTVAQAWQCHQKGTYNAFLKSRYDVEKSPEQFRAIASAMVRAETTSAVLDRAIEACRTLADAMT